MRLEPQGRQPRQEGEGTDGCAGEDVLARSPVWALPGAPSRRCADDGGGVERPVVAVEQGRRRDGQPDRLPERRMLQQRHDRQDGDGAEEDDHRVHAGLGVVVDDERRHRHEEGDSPGRRTAAPLADGSLRWRGALERPPVRSHAISGEPGQRQVDQAEDAREANARRGCSDRTAASRSAAGSSREAGHRHRGAGPGIWCSGARAMLTVSASSSQSADGVQNRSQIATANVTPTAIFTARSQANPPVDDDRVGRQAGHVDRDVARRVGLGGSPRRSAPAGLRGASR